MSNEQRNFLALPYEELEELLISTDMGLGIAAEVTGKRNDGGGGRASGFLPDRAQLSIVPAGSAALPQTFSSNQTRHSISHHL